MPRELRFWNAPALVEFCRTLIGDEVPFSFMGPGATLVLLHPDGRELPPESDRRLREFLNQGYLTVITAGVPAGWRTPDPIPFFEEEVIGDVPF